MAFLIASGIARNGMQKLIAVYVRTVGLVEAIVGVEWSVSPSDDT